MGQPHLPRRHEASCFLTPATQRNTTSVSREHRPADKADRKQGQRDVHVVAALDERGAELGVESFVTTPSGYREALRWLLRFGDVERVGVEGTGSYGAGLTRYLLSEGIEVVEISCPKPPGSPRRHNPDALGFQ